MMIDMKAFVSISAVVNKWCLALALGLPSFGLAQLGVGTTTPHPSSMMHIVAGPGNNKGLILPSITSGSRVVLDSTQNMAHGLIFFDNELQKFYYFHQNPKEWYEMDHDWVRKDIAGASPVVGTHIYSGVPGNVGIGTASNVDPAAKLTVVGNQSIGSATWTQDSVAPSNSLIVESWIGVGTRTKVGTHKMDVNGTVQADKFIGEGVTPPGGIIMYKGTVGTTRFNTDGTGKAGTAYEGWAICDGRNGSPDLRGRFVIGQGNASVAQGSNTEYNQVPSQNATGGERESNLTTSELPAHTHTITDPGHDHFLYVSDGIEDINSQDFLEPIVDVSRITLDPIYPTTKITRNSYIPNGMTGITDTNSRGGSNPFENRPPYYVLAYLMKL